MGALDKLPAELILQICSAHSQTGQATLSRLSRTCRRLRDWVQPLVFTSAVHRNMTLVHQIKLLRALEMRPDLAQNLKYISIGPSFDHEPDISPDDSAYVESVLAKFNLPSSISTRWDQEKADGPARLFLIELILLHTPHLTHLDLPMNIEWHLPILFHFAEQDPRSATPLLPRLRILQILHCYLSGDTFEVPFRELVSIFTVAPNLEELWTYNPGSEAGAKFPYQLRNLRRLEFDDICGMADAVLFNMVLFNMMASVEHLEVFGLVWYPETYKWMGQVTVADVWKTLALQKESLKEIRLDMRRGEGDDIMELGVLDWYKLDEFVKLEVLKLGWLPLEFLREQWRSAQPVPPVNDDGFLKGLKFTKTIKEMTFWEPDGELVGSMRRFAEAVAQGMYPDLRRVVVAPPEKNWDRWFPGWLGEDEWVAASEDLQLAFAAGGSGVVFEVQTERADGIRGPLWGGQPSAF